jgi:UDP-N-acetylglucosamine 2-epimerase (non-hydrolysing)
MPAPGAPCRPRLRLLAGGAGGPAAPAAPSRAAIVHVVATRPDAVAVSAAVKALERRDAFRQILVHTGQHWEPVMVDEMLEDLGLPAPDHSLGVGSGSPGRQTARALEASDDLLGELRPAAVVVTGASNSGLGVGLAAVKRGVPVVRMDAGLREHDWSVPEEANRVLLDSMADTLLAPSEQAAEALANEGIGAHRVRIVGSAAVDPLRRNERIARERAVWERYGLDRGAYVLVTLHRPFNVDDDERLARIVEALAALAGRVPVVFPLHPRTRERLGLMGDAHRLLAAGAICGPPLSYLDFLSLEAGAGAVVTDSSTVQEETTALGVRCFTLRATTERVTTLTYGTNSLLGADPRDIADVASSLAPPTPCVVPLWDGRAGERIADALVAGYALVRAAGP